MSLITDIRIRDRSVAWSPTGVALALLLVVAAAVGLYARFVELGIRQLAVDEYYFVVSVRSIVEHGLPRLTGGGFYTRGLLPQYLTAGSVLVFGEGGFAYRLPAVLFNLAAIVASYAYARRHLPRSLALVLPILLLVSSWEVEFARFARMYASLQFTMLLLLLVTDSVLTGNQRAARWIPGVVLLNLLNHQLAVLFLPFLALPAIAAWVRGEELQASTGERSRYLAASVLVAGAGYMLVFADLRNYRVVNRFPEGFEPAARAVLQVPESIAGPGMTLALLAIGALAVRWAVRAYRGRESPTNAALWGWAALVFAAIHSLLPVLVCLTVLVGRYGVRLRTGDREARWTTALALAALVGWILALAAQPSGPPIREAMLGWPDLLDPVIWPWRQELPLMGAVILAALAAALLMNIRRPLISLLRHPAAIIGYVLLAYGMLESLYVSTRYMFFLYPAALLTVIMVAAKAARTRVGLGALVVVLLFSASRDFNPRHLLEVGGREASWRIGRFEGRGATWYPRLDFQGPADFVDSVAVGDPGETGVVTVGLPAVSEYLDVPHAIFYDRETDPRFVNVSRSEGTIDLWSGERLLSTASDVGEYLRGYPQWLLVVAADQDLPAAVRQGMGADRDGEERYRSRDGRLRVLHVANPP